MVNQGELQVKLFGDCAGSIQQVAICIIDVF